MAGVAKWLQEHTGDEYIAGMWRDNLDVQLLWEVHPDDDNPASKEYIAPSWSWANSSRGVQFQSRPPPWEPVELSERGGY